MYQRREDISEESIVRERGEERNIRGAERDRREDRREQKRRDAQNAAAILHQYFA